MRFWMIAVGLLLVACQFDTNLGANDAYLFQSGGVELEARIIHQGNDVIWGFDFFPDGRIIFTERDGRLKIFDPESSETIEVAGAPSVMVQNQGGLLDVYLHPQFDANRTLYLTYSAAVGDGMTTVLAKAELDGNALTHLTELFTAMPPTDTDQHFGSRVVMNRAGFLFVSIGDRKTRDEAQNLGSYYGKILRLNQDGSVPADNPFVSEPGARPEIWSYGHRNIQGLTLHPKTGALWAQEHGPRGGDEINLIQKGKNYGWPVVTYGREYWGPEIGEGVEKAGMKSPVHYWVPSIAPSGLCFYDGEKIPHWRGSLFSGSLALTHLNRLVIADNKVVKEERLLAFLKKRVRAVKQGPDDLLYFSTDDGALVQVRPAESDSPSDPD